MARPTSRTPHAPSAPRSSRRAPRTTSRSSSSRLASTGCRSSPRPNDTSVECLSFKDLYALLGPESTGFNDWSAADDLAGELASLSDEDFGAVNAPYPSAPLQVTAPGEESGTYDSFVEIVLTGIAEERGQDPAARPDYTASPNDNVIIQGIAGSDSSLGWVGFAFVEENLDTIKPLQVDGGGGASSPPQRPSPATSTRSPGTSSSTSTRPRPRRTPPQWRSSTSTSGASARAA